MALRSEKNSPTPRPGRGAFTLTELLIVIGLIVLLTAIGIPAFRAVTGGRSIDSAENMVSAALAQAREDAMALQEPRGILFYPDVDGGRIAVAEVYYYDPVGDPLTLDAVPDRDQLFLPSGIGYQAAADGGGALAVGVVMFDGFGKVAVQQYRLEPGPSRDTVLRHKATADLKGRLDVLPLNVTPTNVAPTVSQVAFHLFDQAQFKQDFSVQPAPADATQNNLRVWLGDNATPFLVNRYNGTLVRAGE